ncbi:zinc finger protein 239 isoform X2 [Meles meles]|uniref:zinc finger protein 239 isoform X2 n=1 Tax=Meles meles TaxID=9662 RepID=UPI001E6A0627|nr:zinc finger protein 239 isoform X2 [Meles meles]
MTKFQVAPLHPQASNGAALRKAALRTTVGSWPGCPDERETMKKGQRAGITAKGGYPNIQKSGSMKETLLTLLGQKP